MQRMFQATSEWSGFRNELDLDLQVGKLAMIRKINQIYGNDKGLDMDFIFMNVFGYL